MDLNKENLIHMNGYYQVVYIPWKDRRVAYDADGNNVDGNYEVRHRQHDTVEYSCASLPSALSVAEHFNRILSDGLYMQEMSEDASGGLFVTLPGESDDDEGGMLN